MGKTLVTWINTNVTTPLTLIGVALVIIAFIVVGIKVLFRKDGEDLRSVLSNASRVIIGGFFIGAAAVIGGLVIKLASQIT